MLCGPENASNLNLSLLLAPFADGRQQAPPHKPLDPHPPEMFPFRSMTAAAPDDQTLLDALRHTGLRLIHSIDASLNGDRVPDELAQLAATYERTGRGVRRTIAFCQRLAQPARDPAKRAAARRHIIRAVEDAIERTDTRADPDILRAELYERLETSEFDEELDHLPPEQAVEHILRDFGLANIAALPPYPRRTPAHLAALAARAAGRPVPPVPESDPDIATAGSGDPDPATVDFILALDASRRRRARPLGP